MKTDWNHRWEEVALAGFLKDWKKNILRLLASSGMVARVKDRVRELVEAVEAVGAGQGCEWGGAVVRRCISVGEVAEQELVFVQTCLGMRTAIRS